MLHTTQESPGSILVLISDAHQAPLKTRLEDGPEHTKNVGHHGRQNRGKAPTGKDTTISPSSELTSPPACGVPVYPSGQASFPPTWCQDHASLTPFPPPDEIPP